MCLACAAALKLRAVIRHMTVRLLFCASPSHYTVRSNRVSEWRVRKHEHRAVSLQVVTLGEEIKQLKTSSKAEHGTLQEQNTELTQVNARLRSKLKAAVELLRRCQQAQLEEAQKDNGGTETAAVKDMSAGSSDENVDANTTQSHAASAQVLYSGRKVSSLVWLGSICMALCDDL